MSATRSEIDAFLAMANQGGANAPASPAPEKMTQPTFIASEVKTDSAPVVVASSLFQPNPQPPVAGNGILPPMQAGNGMQVMDPGVAGSQPAAQSGQFTTAIDRTAPAPADQQSEFAKGQHSQQPAEQPSAQQNNSQQQDDSFGPGDSETVAEFDPNMHDNEATGSASTTAAPQPTQPTASVTQTTVTGPPVITATTSMRERLPAAPKTEFKPTGQNGDPTVKAVMDLAARVEKDIADMKFVTGLALLSDPNAFDDTIPIHAVIREVQWNRSQLFNKSPHDLCIMEAALTAHQAFMLGLEREWLGYDRTYSDLFDMALRARREQFPGATKQEKEDGAIMNDSNLAKMFENATRAKAMAKALEGAGDSWKQVEDGLKRSISLAIAEHTRGYNSRQS